MAADSIAEYGQQFVLWEVADTGTAQVEVRVVRERVALVQVDGPRTECRAAGGRLTVDLKGDAKTAPPVLVVDRSASEPADRASH